MSGELIRLLAGFLLLVAEILVLSNLFDASTFAGVGATLINQGGNFLRWLIVTFGVFLLLNLKNFRSRIAKISASHSRNSWIVFLTVNLVLFCMLVYLGLEVFAEASFESRGASYMWIATGFLTVVSWLFVFVLPRDCIQYVRTEYKTIFLALIGGFFIFVLSTFASNFWKSASDITITGANWCLQLFYKETYINREELLLGLSGFKVHIDSSCSGIEGVIVAILTTLIYLYIERSQLKFPHAFILLPAACITSFLLNIVRITVLIIIGEEISADIAVGGFHSVAGWITSVLVAIFIVFIFSSAQWIQKKSSSESAPDKKPSDSALAAAILIPFLLFAAINLFSGIFFTDFDYAYPFKVIPVLLALAYFWPRYQISIPPAIGDALFAGVLVAAFWIVFSPANHQYNSAFSIGLLIMPMWIEAAWWLLRMVGFLFVAPTLEELVFRGYMLGRVAGETINNTQQPAFHWGACGLSTLFFGLMHSAWFAGAVAGLVFAIVRYRNPNIFNSILAHCLANLLVAIWAISQENWSLI